MTINDNFLIIKLFNDKDSNFTLVNDSLIFKINVYERCVADYPILYPLNESRRRYAVSSGFGIRMHPVKKKRILHADNPPTECSWLLQCSFCNGLN